jgi:hypothetical protein
VTAPQAAPWHPGTGTGARGTRNGTRRTGGDTAPPRVTGGPRRRRRLPHLLLGVVLVVGCATAGVLLAANAGRREPVLVLARPVTAGQVLAAADLRDVRLSAGGGLDVVPAGSAGEVVGRPAAYTLPAGTVLTRAAVGAAQLPPPGLAVVAVALEPGRFPPALAAGARVAVVVAPGPAGTAAPAEDTGRTNPASDAQGARAVSSWEAAVVAVQPDEAGRTTVVSLQTDDADARALAAAPAEQVGLVAVGGVAVGGVAVGGVAPGGGDGASGGGGG